ncbi:MAG TPA: substrate-binding domain-containing protein [Nakamurella sp.]|nr:substrate-binding domain-containing protein [Nakamurella sp.]
MHESGGRCVRGQAPARPGPSAADRADPTAGVRLLRERLAGFAEVYRSAGRPLADEQIIEGDFTVHGGRAAIDQLARSGRGFDAVFAMNDLSAAGVIAGIRESGRTVPGDVAVIGFDDVEVAVHTNPALTAIRRPMHEMGATAAGLLLAALAALAAHRCRRSPPCCRPAWSSAGRRSGDLSSASRGDTGLEGTPKWVTLRS